MSYSEAITKNDLKKILGNIGFGSLNDYIIEQGTSGIWTYRKWKSGVAECWGIYSGSITSRTANAPYNSSVFDIGVVNYPTGFFADIPNVNVNTRIGSHYNLTSYANSYKDNVSISITSNVSGTQTVYAYIYAKGKWKNDIDTYQGIGSIGAVLLDTFHPVGSYYETSDANFDPNTAWGGTWEQVNTGDKVLFTGDTSGDVTLAETVTNFEYITIFFRDNDGIYDSTNLFGNNLAIALSQAHTDYGTTQFYIKSKTFSVRGNRILQQKNGTTVIRNAQVYVRGGAFYQGDYIYITKVVGRNRINGGWHRTA